MKEYGQELGVGLSNVHMATKEIQCVGHLVKKK